MPRELLWLETISFAAWGCSACNWIFPHPRMPESNKPPAKVREEFQRHECAKFPRRK
jgi:hypothetical protein